MINQLILKDGLIKISYGVYSFNPNADLYRFKRNMLFIKTPATRVYVINPILLLFFSMVIFVNIRILKKKNIKNPFIRSIVRLYQGNRILNKILYS